MLASRNVTYTVHSSFLLSTFMINKNGDTSVKSNYRPIAIVTAMSKIFELCLSRIIDVYLIGFKQKHSIDVCIYTVKSIKDKDKDKDKDTLFQVNITHS